MTSFTDYMQNKEHFSQLGQDLLVTYFLQEKRNGYFVEFGATDGISLSNTRLLEKKYDWTGILCEPSPYYIKILRDSDRTSKIDDRCVYSVSGDIVEFIDTDARGLATIKSYADKDNHAQSRIAGETSFIETVSLDDLLDFHDAPETIDYMSIDTEGSEFDILNAFSFSRNISIITVEHNYNHNRDGIKSILNQNNFIRLFEDMSMFDDWYINKGIL